MEYEIAKAMAELYEAYEFLEEIAELTPEEMFEKVEARDKSFIEHIESMEEPPKSTSATTAYSRQYNFRRRR